MTLILDNVIINYNELKVGCFVNNEGYYLKEFSADNHLFCICDNELYIREQPNKSRYTIVLTKNNFNEQCVSIYAILFNKSKFDIDISNNKIPIGCYIGNIGIIKCNDSIHYDFIFNENDMDNQYFNFTEDKVLHIKPQYSSIVNQYKILIEINQMITVFTIECYRPTLVLSNNFLELDTDCTKVGRFIISDVSTKYNMRIIDNDDLYITNDELFVREYVGVSVHDIKVEISSNTNIFTYEFRVYIIPFIYLSNNTVNIDENEMFVGCIENNQSNIEVMYSLQNCQDNQYFEIVDFNRLMISNIPSYRDNNIYTIAIDCKFIIDNNEISYVKNTFVNIYVSNFVNTELNIILDERKKAKYEFTSQISDTTLFTITSNGNQRKLRLVMISDGEICIGNSRKLDIDENILMFSDYKYQFKYLNRKIGNNKILFYVSDGLEKHYSILEIFININDSTYQIVNTQNCENIVKCKKNVIIQSINPDIPKTFDATIFKLNPGVETQYISKRVNNFQIIYNTNKNKCRNNMHASLVIEPIILTGIMKHLTAFYVKCIHNVNGTSTISSESPLVLTLHLPKYRAATKLFAYSMHESLSGFDGKFVPLIPLQNSYQNVYFNLILDGSSSTYVITDTSTAPQCFLSGTNILTPNGYEIIDKLKKGDIITTHDFRNIEIIDICKLVVPSNKVNDPFLIPSGTYGAISDLYLSPMHQVLIDNKFICVKHIANLQQVFTGFTLEYYHIKTADYFRDTIIAEGVITETWSGLDPFEFEFTKHSEFMDKYNSVKIDEYSRTLLLV
jgi:hypothetical protein